MIPEKIDLFNAIKNDYLHSIEDAIDEDCQIEVDDANLADCLVMWDREINTARNIHNVQPSDYRIAGYLAFWIRKLKPFSLSSYDINIKKRYELGLLINEYIAIQIGLYMLYIDDSRQNKKLSPKLLLRTMKTMRYRSLSPHTMSLMYEFFFEDFSE